MLYRKDRDPVERSFRMAQRLADMLSSGGSAVALLESAGVLVVLLDDAGKICHMNRAAEDLAGHALAGIVGKDFRTLLLDPAATAKWPSFSELRAQSLPLKITLPWVSPTGRHLIRWSVGPIENSLPQGPTVIAVGIDVSEEAEAREVLHERDAMLSSIIDTVPGAVITIDESGVIRSFSASAERTFGYTAGEIVGQKIDVLMPSPFREEHDGYLKNYQRTGVKKIIGIGRVVVALRKNGSTFPIELSVGEMHLRDARLFVGVVRDITAKGFGERQVHQLQTQLLQATRLTGMGEMSSALAHELNQPISAIMSYADAALFLLNESADPKTERVREILGKTSVQARRAGQIVHHLRQFVLTGEGEKTSTDINAVVQDSLAMAMIGDSPSEPTINLKLQPGLSPALIDRVQIQQVLVNLIKNALDALSNTSAPSLTIETSRDQDNQVLVTVSDNGPGIDPEVADRIFHPFVTTKQKGMGMGLSISRSIIDHHRGKLTVERNDAGGATFRFTIPAAQEDDD